MMTTTICLKYKPRDSGVVVTDEEGMSMSMGMGRTIGVSGSLGGSCTWGLFERDVTRVNECQLYLL
jgi:hypothetical protein